MHGGNVGRAVLGLALLDLAAAVAEPGAYGFHFSKSVRRSSSEINHRNRKRQSKTLNVGLDNADIAYLINITLGTPNPQQFSLQIDTGSADLWVPSVDSDACQDQGDGGCPLGSFDKGQSETFQDNVIDAEFDISYQDGSGVSGSYASDTLGMGGISVKKMIFGLAEQASRPVGILGIGYANDESLASGDSSQAYPNVVNQLQKQGYIKTLAYSLWLNDLNSDTGSILFGGIDTDQFTGPLTVLPIQKNVNGSYTDFTVVLSSLSLVDSSGQSQYSQNNLNLPVILDSGTTATYVPDEFAQPILSGVGAINDPDLGYIVPCNIGASPDVFTFGFGGQGGAQINITFAEFVMPLYDDNGNTIQFSGSGETVCGWGLLSSGPQDPNSPILLGDTFLRSAYVVYNLANNEIGLAQTDFNATSTNVVAFSDTSIPSAASTATAAAAVTASYTGHPLEQGHTRTAGGAAFSGGIPSPTFNLGIPGATGSGGKKKNAAGQAASPPSLVGSVSVVAGGVLMMSMVLGGSLMVFM